MFFFFAEDSEADVGEIEHDKNVPDPSASVSVQSNDAAEQKATMSTEGLDGSDSTTPDDADALGVSGEIGDKQNVIDVDHLNTDSVTPNPLSPANSPVHVVRTLITQDDPLGLFTSTVTSASCKTTADPRTSRSSDNVIESARMGEQSLLTRRISEDAIGRTSWVAGATDSSLRKCSSLNRLSSECSHCKASAVSCTAVNPVSDSNRPSSASPRTSLLGGTFRSAATRFASKYRVIRESMVPPASQPTSAALPPPSGTSQQHSISSAGDTTPGDITPGVTNSEADNTPVPTSAVTTDTIGTTVPDITVMTQAGKSRLRVAPALYSPLGKCLDQLASVFVCLHVFLFLWFCMHSLVEQLITSC